MMMVVQGVVAETFAWVLKVQADEYPAEAMGGQASLWKEKEWWRWVLKRQEVEF